MIKAQNAAVCCTNTAVRFSRWLLRMKERKSEARIQLILRDCAESLCVDRVQNNMLSAFLGLFFVTDKLPRARVRHLIIVSIFASRFLSFLRKMPPTPSKSQQKHKVIEPE